MKYLLLISAKPGTQPTADVFLRHKEWVEQETRKGFMEAVYVFAGSNDGMCIVNADSPEDLNDLMMAAPAGPFADVQIKPLADFAKQMDRVAAALKRAN